MGVRWTYGQNRIGLVHKRTILDKNCGPAGVLSTYTPLCHVDRIECPRSLPRETSEISEIRGSTRPGRPHAGGAQHPRPGGMSGRAQPDSSCRCFARRRRRGAPRARRQTSNTSSRFSAIAGEPVPAIAEPPGYSAVPPSNPLPSGHFCAAGGRPYSGHESPPCSGNGASGKG